MSLTFDVAGLILGVLLLAIGAGWVFPPAGVMVLGAGLLVLCWPEKRYATGVKGGDAS